MFLEISQNSFNSQQFFTSCFSYEPEDALEWALVLDEIKGFIKADAAVSVLHADSNPIVLSHRCVKSALSTILLNYKPHHSL
jgi:Protein SCAI